MDTGRFRPGIDHLPSTMSKGSLSAAFWRGTRSPERRGQSQQAAPNSKAQARPRLNSTDFSASRHKPALRNCHRNGGTHDHKLEKLERTRTRGPPAGRICALRSTSRSCASPGASRAKSELRPSLIQLSAKTVPAQSTSPPTKRIGRHRDQRTQSLTFRTCCIATLASSRTPV
jgi:hypothetical protein